MNVIDCAVRAALEAGEAILDIYGQEFEVTYKQDRSPLTAADQAAHDRIASLLEPTAHPVLSEESTRISPGERSGWTTFWLVDPLDGTKEFVNRNGEFTVNIALVSGGKPVAGVVYVPVTDTLYVGVVDVPGIPPGAWKTERCRGRSTDAIRKTAVPCHVSGSPRRTLRIVASKSHFNDQTRSFIAAVEKSHGPPEFVSRGSSLKLCMVADGSADLYPRLAPTMEWDTAAAHAVVTAAGGAVFRFDPAAPTGDYLAGSPDLESLTYNKDDLLNPFFVVSGLAGPKANH